MIIAEQFREGHSNALYFDDIMPLKCAFRKRLFQLIICYQEKKDASKRILKNAFLVDTYVSINKKPRLDAF